LAIATESINMLNQTKQYYKVIQITDCHLFKTNPFLFSVNCNENFISVINKIKNNDLKDADAIFLTGDLSQDESKESYELIVKQLANINLPIYWIPGNHDDIDVMESVFDTSPFFKGSHFKTLQWNFIFLNTKKIGTDKGYISENELTFLQSRLDQIDNNKPTAIIMHHHPVPVGTPLIDEYVLVNNSLFMMEIKGKVDLVICGHVHGDYSIKCENITIETAPATCLQWTKGTNKLNIENKIGYKIYYFKEKSYVAKSVLWSDKKNKLFPEKNELSL